MKQYDLALDKYWVKQSGYFRLATTVTLGIGIANGKLLFCHGILEGSVDKKISTKEYNTRTIYDCFKNTFPADCGSQILNPPTITIEDINHMDKRAL